MFQIYNFTDILNTGSNSIYSEFLFQSLMLLTFILCVLSQLNYPWKIGKGQVPYNFKFLYSNAIEI